MGLLFLLLLMLLIVPVCIDFAWKAIKYQRFTWLGVSYFFWLFFSLLNPIPKEKATRGAMELAKNNLPIYGAAVGCG